MITDRAECQDIVNNMSGEEAMAMIVKMTQLSDEETRWWEEQAEKYGVASSVLFASNKGMRDEKNATDN